MSSSYGENIRLTIFGQSHSPAIGMTLEGIPAGERIDLEMLQRFLRRRAPGQSDYTTPRKEADESEFLSGLVDGTTCGACNVNGISNFFHFSIVSVVFGTTYNSI